MQLISRPDMSLITTENYIISASDMGTLEVFNKETLEQHANILVDRNSSPPFVHDNALFWFTGTVLRHINLSDNSVSKICEIQNKVVSSLEKVDNDIYAADEKGNLIKVSMGSHTSINTLRLSDERAWKPIRVGEYIFIASKKALHQIEG